MAAGKYTLRIEQGATLRKYFTLTTDDEDETPISLVGWSGAAKVRALATSGGAAIATLTVGFNADRSDGVVIVSATAVETAAIPVTANTTTKRTATKYVWDLELTKPDGTVIRLVEGICTVSPEVTR